MTHRQYFLLCLGLVSICPSLAQTPTRHQWAFTVFERLVHEYDDGRKKPRLKIIDNRKVPPAAVAVFTYENTTVTIDEKVLTLCQQLGPQAPNALAVVLSHELAHYYQNHHLKSGYVGGYAGLAKAARSVRTDTEREADAMGCYKAHLAGYYTEGIFAQILTKIYDSYGLNAQLVGYDERAVRVRAYDAQLASLQALVPTEQAGVLLYTLRQYEAAAECFTEVSKAFASVDILNNAAACYLQAAILNDPTLNKGFVFPVELETQSRLTVRSRGKSEANRYLAQAEELLQNALKKDPNYAPVLINWACWHLLKGDASAALQALNELPATQRNAAFFTAKGIAHANAQQYTEAATALDKATTLRAAYGRFNQERLECLLSPTLCSLTALWQKWQQRWQHPSATLPKPPASWGCVAGRNTYTTAKEIGAFTLAEDLTHINQGRLGLRLRGPQIDLRLSSSTPACQQPLTAIQLIQATYTVQAKGTARFWVFAYTRNSGLIVETNAQQRVMSYTQYQY